MMQFVRVDAHHQEALSEGQGGIRKSTLKGSKAVVADAVRFGHAGSREKSEQLLQGFVRLGLILDLKRDEAGERLMAVMPNVSHAALCFETAPMPPEDGSNLVFTTDEPFVSATLRLKAQKALEQP